MAVRQAEQHRRQYKPNAAPGRALDKRLKTPICPHLTIIVVARGWSPKFHSKPAFELLS
jgi:hypothetical protein